MKKIHALVNCCEGVEKNKTAGISGSEPIYRFAPELAERRFFATSAAILDMHSIFNKI